MSRRVFWFCWVVCLSGCERGVDRDAALEQARAALRQDKAAEAIGVLRPVLVQDPDDAPVRYHLGLALLADQQIAAARWQFYRAAQADSTHAEALRQLGVLAYQAGDQQEALLRLEGAVQHGAREAFVHDLLAYLYSEFGRLEAARQQVQAAVDLAPGEVRYRLKEAVIAQQLGDYDRAREILLTLVEGRAAFWQAQFLLGQVLRAQNEHEAAVGALRQALQYNPSEPQIFYHLGASLLHLGQVEGAVAAFEAAIKQAPEHIEAHYGLGRAYLKRGQKKQAKDVLQKFRRYQQQVVGQTEKSRVFLSYWRQGLAAEGAGDFSEAVALLNKALEMEPDDVYARLLLWLVYEKMDARQAAEAVYRDLRRLTPDVDEACVNLGIELMRRGEVEKALSVLERAVAQRPDDLRARYYLAVVCDRLGHIEQAGAHGRVLEGG